MELVSLTNKSDGKMSKTQIEIKIEKLKKSENMKTVIYATTGSVACIKSKEII